MVDVVSAAKADVSAAKAEVVTVKSKIRAWIAAHVPHAISAAAGFAVSHFSVISYLVHKL
jgi:hypothetical protein